MSVLKEESTDEASKASEKGKSERASDEREWLLSSNKTRATGGPVSLIDSFSRDELH